MRRGGERKKLLKTPVLFDLRNLHEPGKVKSLGVIYEGLGRNCIEEIEFYLLVGRLSNW